MACLARDGHDLIGVDVNPQKVNSVKAGRSPIIEPGLEALIQAGVASERVKATCDVDSAIQHAEIAMICVGTPSKRNGDLELKYVERVCRDIGHALAAKDGYTVVVVRSTVLPGSASERLIPALEAGSGKTVGQNLGFCINPEAPIYRIPIGVAEMIKYASNAFHALKVVFANEIGNICQQYGIDSHQVMDVFTQDTKLNLSPYYLKPGFSFGGSCLGKDLRALLYAARQRDVRAPVLESVLPSNQLQTQKAVDMLLQEGKRKVGLIGLSFKPNTDDLRESPAIELAERLIGKGFELWVYDREVSLSRLQGSNRAYIDQVIPHISSLMRPSLEETIDNAEAVVVAKRLTSSEREQLLSLLRPQQILIDLVRLNGQHVDEFGGKYCGICW
jgi:GDP-mannose 6-dehydrogenase